MQHVSVPRPLKCHSREVCPMRPLLTFPPAFAPSISRTISARVCASSRPAATCSGVCPSWVWHCQIDGGGGTCMSDMSYDTYGIRSTAAGTSVHAAPAIDASDSRSWQHLGCRTVCACGRAGMCASQPHGGTEKRLQAGEHSGNGIGRSSRITASPTLCTCLRPPCDGGWGEVGVPIVMVV